MLTLVLGVRNSEIFGYTWVWHLIGFANTHTLELLDIWTNIAYCVLASLSDQLASDQERIMLTAGGMDFFRNSFCYLSLALEIVSNSPSTEP